MTAPTKLTDEQIAFARQVMARKHEAIRQVRMYPTQQQLAREMGCALRYLQKILRGKVRKSTRVALAEQIAMNSKA